MAPLAFLALVLSAQPVTSLAVPGFTTVEVKPELATFYSDHVAAALRKRGFRVVTAGEMAGLLSMERQKQLLGCAEDSASCLAELGSALGCSATLLGNLVRLEDTYHATLKVLRSSDGAVLAEVQVKATGQNALLDELAAAAGRLADGLDAANRPAGEVVAARPLRLKPWALAPLVLSVLSFGGGALCLGLAGGKYDALRASLDGSRQVDTTALTLQKDGTALQLAGWVGLGVGAAALVTAGLMYFLGADGPAPVAWVSPAGAGLGLAGSWP